MARHVITGNGAPNFAPEYPGQHYVDLQNGAHYSAVGTAGPEDWSAGGGGGGDIHHAAYHDESIAAGTMTFDPANGYAQRGLISENVDVVISDPPETNDHWQMLIVLTQGFGGPYTVTWAGVEWEGGVAPPAPGAMSPGAYLLRYVGFWTGRHVDASMGS